jgi:hypothetical protein
LDLVVCSPVAAALEVVARALRVCQVVGRQVARVRAFRAELAMATSHRLKQAHLANLANLRPLDPLASRSSRLARVRVVKSPELLAKSRVLLAKLQVLRPKRARVPAVKSLELQLKRAQVPVAKLQAQPVKPRVLLAKWLERVVLLKAAPVRVVLALVVKAEPLATWAQSCRSSI